LSNNKYILAVDQGTSSTKSLVFDENGKPVARGSEPLHTNYLDNGFVEQDPEKIYENVLTSIKKCLQQFNEKGLDQKNIAAIGISNQRETFVVWDKDGKPLHPAIVWQCKRSVGICDELKQGGLSAIIQQKTGLVIDPYFSATKLIWLFQHNERIKKQIQSGNAFFGTIDTWLLYKFTNGKEYATDHTNASRTLFFNLHTLQWDHDLIDRFGLTGIQLPQIKSSSSLYGLTTLDGLLKEPVAITALIGDSHAAAFGESCYEAGTAKATLGTGCSILMNIGNKPLYSKNGMVTTICWSIDGRVDYALEGVIVSCGVTIEWLKNELSLFAASKDTEAMATSVPDNNGVYLIPAFSGLGAPHWDMNRKASVTGLTFSTGKNHIVRAALESIPYQVKDVIESMEADTGIPLQQLMIDGGISANGFIVQFLADLLNKPVTNIGIADVSALGAAYLAGLQQKIFTGLDHLSQLNLNKTIVHPSGNGKVKTWHEGWKEAIKNG
jgi:glycerol kinase